MIESDSMVLGSCYVNEINKEKKQIDGVCVSQSIEKRCFQGIRRNINFSMQSWKKKYFLTDEDNFEKEKGNNFVSSYEGFVLKWHSTFAIVLKELEFEIWRRHRKILQHFFAGTYTYQNVGEKRRRRRRRRRQSAAKEL